MNKSRLLLLFLLCAIPFCCQAQSLRRWNEGPMNWTGFRTAEPSDSVSSHVSYTLAKKKEHFKARGATYYYLDYSAAFIPETSRVKEGAKNDAELQSLQKEFDILEYFARAYRDELLYANVKDIPKETDYIARFRAALEEARLTGDYSKYALSREPFDVSAIEYDAPSKFTGVTPALFTDLPIGDQGRVVYPTVGFSGAFELGRDKHAFGLQAQIGVSAYRRHYLNLVKKTVPYFGITAFYRRELMSGDKANLSVWGGPGFSGRHHELIDEYVLIGGPSLSEGIIVDLFAGRAVSLSRGHPEQVDRYWQFELTVNELYNLSQGKVFPAVNLSAGLYFQSRHITRK